MEAGILMMRKICMILYKFLNHKRRENAPKGRIEVNEKYCKACDMYRECPQPPPPPPSHSGWRQRSMQGLSHAELIHRLHRLRHLRDSLPRSAIAVYREIAKSEGSRT